MQFLNKIDAFMNDPDRGPGHGHGNGLFYGIILIALAPLPIWVMIVAMCLNHGRVLYQELYIEGWVKKPKEPDFWYDAAFRPLCSGAMAIGFQNIDKVFWPVLSVIILLIGYKTKEGWPFLIQIFLRKKRALNNFGGA